MISILFVCLGNICRSPCAEGVLKHFAKNRGLNMHIESCGLGDWHEGQLPDKRMRETSQARGIILSSRVKAFQNNFFDKFDWILVADRNIFNELHKWAKIPEHKAKIHLLTKFSPNFRDLEIPDPFYEDIAQFELVMDMIEDACKGFLDHLENCQ